MRGCFAFLALFATLAGSAPVWAETIAIEAERESGGGAVKVQTRLALPFDFAEVWDVLNDYEHMPRFVPDIHRASLIQADKNHKVVKLDGVTTLLFLHFPIEVVVDVRYLSDRRISLKSVSGNLDVRADVRLDSDGNSTRVTYVAYLQPSFWLPPVIGPYLIGQQIRRQFEGQVAEMHRRYDAKHGSCTVVAKFGYSGS